jgi:serine/threonine-protein kinase
MGDSRREGPSSRRVEVDPGGPHVDPGRRLLVRGRLDEGAMGIVYEAFDASLLRPVALKTLSPELEDDGVALRRLIEEAQITAQLQHPNIVPVHELGIDEEGSVYFTMKIVEGRTLAEILGEKGPGERTASDLFGLLQVFLKVCDAVAFAHSRGVLHRDLKPSNVMVGEFGEVYVLDWGIAKLKASPGPAEEGRDGSTEGKDLRATRTADGKIVGTPCYLAPEQADPDSGTIDERTDVFCLGATLYEVLTLAPPILGRSFTDVIQRAVECTITPPEAQSPYDLPRQLCGIAMKALKKDPGERYPSVSELKRDIEGFLRTGWGLPKRSFSAGSLIVREGEHGDEAFVIVRGRCRAFKGSGGERVVLREMGKGEVFGETAVFTDQVRTASIEAIDDVSVAVVSSDLFERGAGMWLGRFGKALAERFREKESRLFELEDALTAAKVSNEILLRLSRSRGDTARGRPEIAWSGLRAELANRFGRTADEIASLVEPCDTFSVDPGRDVISLA